MERLNCVSQQFSKENNGSRNVCVNSTNRIVQEICNDRCNKISNSRDLSSDNLNKTLKQDECVPAYQCDKPSDYVFIDVGSDFIESGYLLEENDNVCKVSSETVFTDSIDIDCNLVKNVNIERCLKCFSKENEMNNHNLETSVFNINDIYTGNVMSGLSTNACMENVCEDLDNHDTKPTIDIDYTTSTVVSASGGFEKVNTCVKEENSIEDVLVHQNTKNMSPEIKKEELDYNEEISVLNESIIDTKLHTVNSASGGFEKENTCVKEENSIEDVLVHQNTENMSTEIKKEELDCNQDIPVLNESIIDTKLHPVNKVEEPPDISTNCSYVLVEKSETGFIVLSKTVNSDFQEVHTELSEEMPNNSDIGVGMVLKPLKENETVQSKRESHVELRNKVQTRSRTHSELQTKPQTNSEDDIGADGAEECNNKFSEDVNTGAKNKKDQIRQHHRQTKSKHTTDTHYICKVCCKHFTQLCDLKAHQCTHTGHGSCACDMCGKKFTQLRTLKDHKRIHTDDRTFICDTCGKAFTRRSYLKKHKRVHTGDKPFNCSTCGKAFAQWTNLKRHIRIHMGDKPFGCSTCGKTFTQMVSLKRHERIHTGDRPFACDTCGKAFTHRDNLKRHIRMHMGDRPFGCSTCGKTFTDLANLKCHERTHTGERPFGCDTCGKAFTNSSDLKKHKNIHTGDRTFDCDTCGKSFTHLAYLKCHKRIHTGERPFGCDTCGKAFRNCSDLKKHKDIHTGDRTFVCDTCGKTFTHRDYLKRHIRIHMVDRPFGCDTCGKAFSNGSDLNKHKDIHTGERPFGCDTCGKAFTQLAHLKRHIRIHMGDKPFGCTTCGKTFTQRGNLKVHKYIHSGDRPFGCDTTTK